MWFLIRHENGIYALTEISNELIIEVFALALSLSSYQIMCDANLIIKLSRTNKIM